MIIYLATIAVLSLVLGALLDVIYPLSGVVPGGAVAAAREVPLWLSIPSAVLFAALLGFSFRRTSPPAQLRMLGNGIGRLIGFRITPRQIGHAAVWALGIWFLTLFFFQVPPGNRGLLRRFGAPHGDPRGEGLHLRWPAPIDAVDVVAVDAVHRVEIGFRTPGSTPAGGSAPVTPTAVGRELEEESLFLTGDENLLDVRTAIQYRIADPERYVYGFDDPERVVKTQAIAELVEVLAEQHIDGVYTDDRRHVEGLAREGLERRVDALGLGVEILHFGIRDVHAPPEVHAAFRDVASAQEDKQTSVNVALRYLDETVNLARGEAARDVAVAGSFAVREVTRAEGGAASLENRAKAYREYPVGTYTRLYLETMEEVLATGRKIIRPGNGGTGNVDLWISTDAGDVTAVEGILRGSRAGRADQSENGE